jgi:hypothetical protein
MGEGFFDRLMGMMADGLLVGVGKIFNAKSAKGAQRTQSEEFPLRSLRSTLRPLR